MLCDRFEPLERRRKGRERAPRDGVEEELEALLDCGIVGRAESAPLLRLARVVDPGLVASAGPRFFGFVTGGTLPAALAADWLTSVWDQNAGLYVESPAASVVEDVVAGWLLELLGLPPTASVGFVTGGQMANFTCLAAARRAVLLAVGWDVEDRGLHGAPPVNVVVSADAHVTVFTALQLLGLGAGRARRVPTDAQGRIRRPADRRGSLGQSRPLCAQCCQQRIASFILRPLLRSALGRRGHVYV